MNWNALENTILTFAALYFLCKTIRLIWLDRKSRLTHKIWEAGAHMLLLKTTQHTLMPGDEEILRLCEMCRVAANEIADDAKNHNPSYWILTARKQYNIPVILEFYATLRNNCHPNLRHQDREFK